MLTCLRRQELPLGLFPLLLAATMCNVAQASMADSAGDDELSPQKLVEIAEEIRKRFDQPAVAVAYVRGDHDPVAVATGVRSMQADDAVTLNDRFHFGSCTKAMTATLIGMLVHEEKLDWDDPVLSFFPEFTDSALEDYREITVRDLLSHRAGLVAATDGMSPEAQSLHELTGTPRQMRRQAVELFLSMEPPVSPRSESRYSNAGYAIAAAIAEEVTDRPWEDLLRAYVFEPMRMEHAGFGWPATTDNPEQPRGHLDFPKGLHPLPVDTTYRLDDVIAPAGNVHGTVTDLARFAQAHLLALRGKSTSIPTEIARKLHMRADESRPEALGWIRLPMADQPASWHNGSTGTFFAWMTIWPELDLAVVVITNAGNGEPACAAITERIAKRFMEATADEDSPSHE